MSEYHLIRYENDHPKPLTMRKEPYLKIHKTSVYLNRWACELLNPFPCRVAFYLDREAKAVKIVREDGERCVPGQGNFRMKYKPAQVSAQLHIKAGMPLGIYRYHKDNVFIHESKNL